MTPLLLAADAPRGGVVLVPDTHGVDADRRAWARALVSAGWDVAMPDLWARGGAPASSAAEDVDAAVAALADFRALGDIAAARDLLDARRPRFVLGFGLGGLYARMAACTLPGFAGAVEFAGRIVYPTITPNKPAQPLDLLLGLTCPLQCHYGDLDPVCPPEHVEELERRLAGARRVSQVFRYPGAGRGFLDRDGPAWDARSATLAWARALHFLDHLADAAG